MVGKVGLHEEEVEDKREFYTVNNFFNSEVLILVAFVQNRLSISFVFVLESCNKVNIQRTQHLICVFPIVHFKLKFFNSEALPFVVPLTLNQSNPFKKEKCIQLIRKPRSHELYDSGIYLVYCN